jgi:hypothetical protein
MQLNASKTKYIIFRTKNKHIDPEACSVVYNSTEIGLPDDPTLITPIERIFNRIKNFVNAKSLRMLYFSMIHSVISYGINIYGCANKTTLEKLIIKQKQAMRIICNATYRAHTSTLFKQLKILPVEKLLQFSNVKLMHSFHFKLLPISFANSWMTNIERNPERTLYTQR